MKNLSSETLPNFVYFWNMKIPFFSHPTLYMYSNKARKRNIDFSNVYLARIKLLKGILTNNYGTTTNSFELYTNFHEEASYRVFAPDHLR